MMNTTCREQDGKKKRDTKEDSKEKGLVTNLSWKVVKKEKRQSKSVKRS